MNELILIACLFLGMPGVPPPLPEAEVVKLARNTEYKTSFVVFPADTNALGTGFGGKLLSEMDRTAGITMRRFLYDSTVHDAVTIGINNVRFVSAAKVKDLLVVSSKITKVGERSVTIHIKIERELENERLELVVEGDFVFVPVSDGKSVPHGLKLKDSCE